MTQAASPALHDVAHHHEHHDDGAKVTLGFWIYLMSDCLIFSVLFATFAVLGHNYAGGPDGKEIFDLHYVFVETMLLLISSFTFGVAMLNLYAGNKSKVIGWLLITFLFGLGFIGMEVYEFHHLILEGNGPDRSAFLSAYFTLVGTHGLHVTFGLIWIAISMHQVSRFGLNDMTRRRLSCLSLFWHFLDIVWICVFTFVYLFGVL
ncbi:MAG: cytochrome o ubiquinol oxidase subunit III [Bordetella sp.]|uniref:cytochrome o ubiquinol oxidase subunit III n=1 Tax=Bordetella sp. TaxID=28081 RepID=UPI003F7C02E6